MLLTMTAEPTLRLGQGFRSALRHIDDDLYFIVQVVWFCGIAARGHTSLFAWASRQCVIIASFPLSARRLIRAELQASDCYSGSRTLGHGCAYEGISSAT